MEMGLRNGLRDKRTVVAQLREELSLLIEEEKLVTGDRLPTELELTGRFRISRPALREALKLLEQDGIINVIHGKGRFISATAALRVERPITCFESVTDMVRRFGYQPNNKVLSISEEEPDPEIAKALALKSSARVIRLERLRMQNDKVIMYCVDYVPRSAIPGRLDDLDWTGSLLDLLEKHYQRPKMSTATASAVMLPQHIVDRNNLHDFGPAFLIEEIAYSDAGLPVAYAQDYHRGSAFSFSFVRK